MKVTVSCAGRFHAYDLVEQLYSQGALHRFITTVLDHRLFPNRDLPVALRTPEALELITTVPVPEYVGAGIRQLPFDGSLETSYLVKDNLYDQRAARLIDRCDVFVGWANQSLFQLREAKVRGARTVIERGSCHVQFQEELIDRERSLLGLELRSAGKVHALLVDKQLKEYHEADYIMVPSDFARRSFLAKGYPENKILKNPYGVDLTRFHPLAGRTYLKDGVLRILAVSPLSVQKGTHRLLRAVKAVKSQGQKVHLTIIGRAEREFSEWLKASGLADQIDQQVDFVPHQELIDHYHASDVFCLPSLQEGLALVIAEAMACGTIPVVSDHTGGEELLDNGVHGRIFDADSETDLVEALLSIADATLMQKYAAAAIERANSLSWTSYGDRALAHYRQILDAPERQENGGDISSYYDDYWKSDVNWTPSHSFSQEQLRLHFDDLFVREDVVLDVGCGDASNYQAWLLPKVKHLAGIDISETGVAKAKRLGMEAVVHDFAKPFPFQHDLFDKAICIEVLEHLYDPKFCVSEIYRVVKPGGLFIMSVPNNGYFRERLKALTKAELSTSITDFGNEWKGAHIRFYNERSITRMLEVCGFEVEEVRSNGDGSIFDGLDALGGYITQHASTALRRRLPPALKLSFLQDLWPSMFAPHLIIWARKPQR